MSSALTRTFHLPSGLVTALGQCFTKPSRTFRLANQSMAPWRVELVSGGAVRGQNGLLSFRLLDPGNGRRTIAGRLAAVGDGVVLKPGAIYEVEVHPGGGTFLRFFRMVDARGRGGSLRFFMEGEGDLVPRLYDGALAGGTEMQPLRQLEPGVLAFTRNCW